MYKVPEPCLACLRDSKEASLAGGRVMGRRRRVCSLSIQSGWGCCEDFGFILTETESQWKVLR